jgi:methyl-accepting chemotaxis protein
MPNSAVQKTLFGTLIKNAILTSSVAMLVSSVLLYQAMVAPIEENMLREAMLEEEAIIQAKITAKQESVKAMSLMTAQRPDVIEGLKTNDRSITVNGLKGVQAGIAKVSDFNTVYTHVIDAQKNSFVKSWKIDSFGEPTKHSIVDRTLSTKKAQINFGITSAGVGVLGSSPVMFDDQLVGVVTNYQGVGSITRDLKAMQKDWLMLLDDRALTQLFGSVPKNVAENMKISDHFLVAHMKWFESDFMNEVSQHYVDLLADDKPHAKVMGDRMVVVLPIVDSAGLLLGRHVVARSAEALQQHIQDKVYFAVALLVGILLLVFGVVFALMMLVKAKVIRPVQEASSSINQVLRTGRFDVQLSAMEQNEIGMMMNDMNRLFHAFHQVIQETNQVVSAIADGDTKQRITSQYIGDLDLLKQGVNQSAENIHKVMQELSKAMSELSKGHFGVVIDTSAHGEYGVMLSNANTAMSSLKTIIDEIVGIMKLMRDGNFGVHIKGQANGDLLLLKNDINASMVNLTEAINKMAEIVSAQAMGDLTMELQSGVFKGQLHDLKNAINYSSAKVKESVIQAIDTSNTVTDAATQVAQGASDLSGRVQEQAAALEETSATMNEMAAAIQANTANAEKVADLAHQVRHQTGAGVDVMQKTISAMQSIKESSSKIADIVTLIDGIAFQTNLLALNAAVEAARAGDHGRGFAVVAGEVRALAQKSAEAAKDIKELINDSVGRIEAGTQLADKSGEMLSGITGSIEQVAEMIESIAHASQEQAQGIQQVHRAIADIDRVTQENAALVEETNAAAESLNTEAHHLKENMNFFRTGVTSTSTHSNTHHPAKKPMKSVSKPAMGLPSPKSGTSNEWSDF